MSDYSLYTVRNSGEAPESHGPFGDPMRAIDVAIEIAQGSGDDGAISVWVEDRLGGVVWAAGEKAQQLGWGTYTPVPAR